MKSTTKKKSNGLTFKQERIRSLIEKKGPMLFQSIIDAYFVEYSSIKSAARGLRPLLTIIENKGFIEQRKVSVKGVKGQQQTEWRIKT